MRYITCSNTDQTQGKIPHKPLIKLGLPLFPDGTEAISVFLGLEPPKNGYGSDRIVVRVPDYRARIKNLRLNENRVTVEVETLTIASTNVRAKFFCKSENNQVCTSEDMPLKDGCATYLADLEPLQGEVHIVSVLDGKSIDHRTFDYQSPWRMKGVILENSETQLLDIITRGENETVEFKKTLPVGRREAHRDFLETVVAFANTKGGMIFLGVDDNCRIEGFGEEGIRDRIEDMIVDSCDPPVEVRVNSIKVQETKITLVEILDGTKKLYLLKGKRGGIFVRRGASDRQITKPELDAFCTRGTLPSNPFY